MMGVKGRRGGPASVSQSIWPPHAGLRAMGVESLRHVMVSLGGTEALCQGEVEGGGEDP